MTATMLADLPDAVKPTWTCPTCGVEFKSFATWSRTDGEHYAEYRAKADRAHARAEHVTIGDDGVNVDAPAGWTGGAKNAGGDVEQASEKAVALLTALVRCSTVTITKREGGDLADVEGIVEAAVETIGTGKRAVARSIDKLKAEGATPIEPGDVAESSPEHVRPNRYAGSCARCHGHVAEGAGTIAKLNGRWIVQHVGECPSAAAEPVGVLDLTALPEGRYGVPGSDSRLKVQIDKPTSGRYAGNVYVKDAAEYGHGRRYGRQLAGELYAGQIVDELQAILADPMTASMRYGELTSRCGVCNRPLEAEGSVTRGIGPVCAAKLGWA